MLTLASPYQQELGLILTAPSLRNTFTAIGIISEIGVNMEAFPSAKHLCSWANLTPTNNESAGKKKSVRVSKARCHIKPLFIQCTNFAVKSEKHPEIRNRYLRCNMCKSFISFFHVKMVCIKQLQYSTHYSKSYFFPISNN